MGDFGGSGEARMGGFAAKFRGFLGWARVQRGYSAHGGHRRALGAKKFLKIFKKGVENPKIGGMRGTKRVLYRRCGAIFEPGSYTSSSVAGGALRAGASAADTHLRSQRFAPLIYGEPICKLHCSLHEGISACPTRNSSTLTCGLMLPTYRILVTTISSQSRQENPVSEQDTAKEPQTSSTPITDSPPELPENNEHTFTNSSTSTKTSPSSSTEDTSSSTEDTPSAHPCLLRIKHVGLSVLFPLSPIINNLHSPLFRISIKYIAYSVIFPILIWFILCLQDSKFGGTDRAHLIVLSFMPLAIPLLNLHPQEETLDDINNSAPAEEKTAEKIESPNNKNEHPALSTTKTILSLSPLTLAFAFIFTLSYYSWVVDGNIGTAFQVASIQASQDKYRLVSSALILLLIGYLAFLPAIIAGNIKDFKNDSPTDVITHLNNNITLTLRIAAATFLSAFVTSFILRLTAPELHGLYLHYFIVIAFVISQAISTADLPSNIFTSVKNSLTHNLTFRKALIPVIILVFIPTNLINRLQEFSIRTGETISASKTGDLDPMQAYSCVFPKNNINSESIAFGIIAPSTISSLHIFTPELNQESKKYTHIKDGKIFPNNPTESYINIKIDYTIENYDSLKHEFDNETGKCKRKTNIK